MLQNPESNHAIMQVHWLLDADMFDGYRDELVACIRTAGHQAHLIRPPQPPYRWDDVGSLQRNTFPKDACVVAHGDIGFVTHFAREQLWIPGAFATVENFACSSYYCRFGKFVLNQDYVMLPFGELGRQRDFLFRTLGNDNRVFIRPDSPLKLFAGQVAARDTFDADLEFMGFYEFPPSSIVLVSSPEPLRAEWRFVVANRQIVAGCQYKAEGEKALHPHYKPAAFDLAATIAAGEYQPDPVWVMDLCQTDDGKFHLLEIGGFSFADLYVCDKAAIAKAVSEAAAGEWRRAKAEAAPSSE